MCLFDPPQVETIFVLEAASREMLEGTNKLPISFVPPAEHWRVKRSKKEMRIGPASRILFNFFSIVHFRSGIPRHSLESIQRKKGYDRLLSSCTEKVHLLWKIPGSDFSCLTGSFLNLLIPKNENVEPGIFQVRYTFSVLGRKNLSYPFLLWILSRPCLGIPDVKWTMVKKLNNIREAGQILISYSVLVSLHEF